MFFVRAISEKKMHYKTNNPTRCSVNIFQPLSTHFLGSISPEGMEQYRTGGINGIAVKERPSGQRLNYLVK
jgi:hypothetical protein